MTKWISGCVVLCGFVVAGAAVQAHHSLAGVYALGKEATVHGTFNSFKIVNPHSSMKLDVKNADGTITTWSFVGGSAGQIARFGLKDGPNALRVGDEVTVTCTPAADGKSPVGLLVAITYQDGHTVRFRSPDE
jgi:Family of unknown function (DUF6152)